MANIQKAEYENFPGYAGQMRSYGQELNNELKTVYTNIENMHNVWYGQRYNSLVKEFNKIIPEINELLDLVVGDVPFTLESIANNYSQKDQGSNVTSAQKTAPNKIVDLTIHNDVGMRFISTDVETIQGQVSTNLDNAKAKMDTIESIYQQMQWESEAADSFRSTFTNLKSNIVTSFENIKSQFIKLMNQTLADIQAAENANTIK